MKCPFCGSKDLRKRGEVPQATKRLNKKHAPLKLPRRRWFCAGCRRVVQVPE